MSFTRLLMPPIVPKIQKGHGIKWEEQEKRDLNGPSSFINVSFQLVILACFARRQQSEGKPNTIGEPIRDPMRPLTSEKNGIMFANKNPNRTKEKVINNQNEYDLQLIPFYVLAGNTLLCVCESGQLKAHNRRRHVIRGVHVLSALLSIHIRKIANQQLDRHHIHKQHNN